MKPILKIKKPSFRVDDGRCEWAYITLSDGEELVLFGGKKYANGVYYRLRNKKEFVKKVKSIFSLYSNDLRQRLHIYNFFCDEDFTKYKVSKEELKNALLEYGLSKEKIDEFLHHATEV